MKLHAEVSLDSIKNVYLENKNYTFPAVSIIVAILLFIIFIIPQIAGFPEKKRQIDAENAKLNKITQSAAVASSIDTDLLDSNTQISLSALPSGKDFEAILNAISTAAGLANVIVDSYQYQSGNSLVPQQIQKVPTLSFQITIFGGLEPTVEFVDQLYKTYPVSEVTNISSAEDESTISINFYYKPLPPIGFEDKSSLRMPNSKEQATLSEISKWNSFGDTSDLIPSATTSSQTGSPF